MQAGPVAGGGAGMGVGGAMEAVSGGSDMHGVGGAGMVQLGGGGMGLGGASVSMGLDGADGAGGRVGRVGR